MRIHAYRRTPEVSASVLTLDSYLGVGAVASGKHRAETEEAGHIDQGGTRIPAQEKPPAKHVEKLVGYHVLIDSHVR